MLAEPKHRATIVRLCVAFEVMYDFIDGLTEQPARDVLANNRQFARALTAALTPNVGLQDYYAHHAWRSDGGYLHALIRACREALIALPRYPTVAPALVRAAQRAGEAQSLNHSSIDEGNTLALQQWAETQDAHGLNWWETAAAAGAPLGIYALFALASRADVTSDDVQEIEAGYFPWISGLLGIMESLVDQSDDARTGNHSYVSHYESDAETTGRLRVLAERSAAHAQRLRQSQLHLIILAGMVSTNLSHRGAADPRHQRAASEVRREIDGPVRALLVLLRLRRRSLESLRRSGS